MFYDFGQTNWGGSFNGFHHIIIEATSADQANTIAVRDTPIYFDGCANGRDCFCCGDRWYEAYGDDTGEDAPTWSGVTLDPALTEEGIVTDNWDKISDLFWHAEDILVVYADGTRREWHFTEDLLEKAKELKRNATPFLYGFRVSLKPTANVSMTWKCFKSDSTFIERWYAANGNDSILGEGWVVDDNRYATMLTYGGHVRKDVETLRTQVRDAVAAIEVARQDAARRALANADLDPTAHDLFMNLLG